MDDASDCDRIVKDPLHCEFCARTVSVAASIHDYFLFLIPNTEPARARVETMYLVAISEDLNFRK